MHKYTIYLSGPMSGYPNYNVDTFNFWADYYRAKDYNVLSPPEISPIDHTKFYADYLKSDLNALISNPIDAVYVLPGWEKSKGANLEVSIARALNIPIHDVRNEEHIELPSESIPKTVADEAKSLVYGDRAASYGHPLDDYRRLSGAINSVFASKLKSDLTPLDMAIFMMLVKISRLVHNPNHRDSLVDIAGYVLVFEKMLERMKHEVELSQYCN